MGKKTEIEALREQVARLTERLEGVQAAEKLTATIRAMQLQAKGQQEEVEHLRAFKAKFEGAAEQQTIDNHHLLKPLHKQVADQQVEITRLKRDNDRLRERLDEIAKGAGAI